MASGFGIAAIGSPRGGLFRTAGDNTQLPLTGLPPEMALEEQAINRRQQIADLLVQQGLQPVQPFQQAGRFIVPMHWAQGLAQLGQVGAGLYGQKQASVARRELAQEHRDQLKEAVRTYQEKLRGTPRAMPVQGPGAPMESNLLTSQEAPNGAVPVSMQGPATIEGPQPTQTITAPPTPDARREAVMTALMSGDPRLQTVANMEYQAERQQDEKAMQREFLAGMQGRKEQSAQDLATQRAHAAEDLTRLKETEKRTTLTDPEVLAGKVQVAGAGAARNLTNIQSYAPAAVEIQKEEAKKLSDVRDKLQTAPQVLNNIAKAKALIASAKGFMGTGGETLLEVAKFMNNRLGMAIDTKGIKSAEELRSRIFFNIMENLKKMDAQPSQMQQQIMQESLGKLGTDPNALPAILDAYAETIREKVELHNQNAAQMKQHVPFPYDPIIKLPKPSAAAPAPPAQGGALTPAEQSELETLRKKYGR